MENVANLKGHDHGNTWEKISSNAYEKKYVRAAMLLRANSLSRGNSGIRLETLQTLIDMLNAGIHPIVPEKGSVVASVNHAVGA